VVQDRWIMVRLDRGTHAELLEVRQSMLRAYEAGQIDLRMDKMGGVPLDAIVSRLCAEHRLHRKRARKARKPADRPAKVNAIAEPPRQ
jgi:hypothetical protein